MSVTDEQINRKIVNMARKLAGRPALQRELQAFIDQWGALDSYTPSDGTRDAVLNVIEGLMIASRHYEGRGIQ